MRSTMFHCGPALILHEIILISIDCGSNLYAHVMVTAVNIRKLALEQVSVELSEKYS